jgi:hypothetical protein
MSQYLLGSHQYRERRAITGDYLKSACLFVPAMWTKVTFFHGATPGKLSCAVTADKFNFRNISVCSESFFLAGSTGKGDLFHCKLQPVALCGVAYCCAIAINAGRIFSFHDVTLLYKSVFPADMISPDFDNCMTSG